MVVHRVKSGETIEAIATKYGVTPQLIINLNQPPNPDDLVIGQTLVIRKPTKIHTVKAGDTLDAIARDNSVTAVTLLQNNPDIIGKPLYIGEDLVISYDDQKNRYLVTNGYTYPNIDRNLLISTLPYLSYLTVFTYGFNRDGTLIEPDDAEIIRIAKDYGVAPVMLISTLTSEGTFSNELANYLLNDVDLQYTLIGEIINAMEEKGYYGLDIDFEYIPAEDRQNYIDFVTRLTNRLNENGFISLVALAPKTSVDQPGLLYESHDYFGLGNAANLALVMTYEWGYTYHHIGYRQYIGNIYSGN